MYRLLYPLFASLALCLLATSRADDADSLKGFVPLFNGRNLTGWKLIGRKLNWGLDEGALYTTGDRPNYLMSEQEYGDCEIRLDYLMPEKGISGLALRAPVGGNPAYAGLEIQIQDDAGIPGLKPTQYSGALYDVVAPSARMAKETGLWNHLRIIAKGRSLRVQLNGTEVVNTHLDHYLKQADKHPGLLRTKGHLYLRSQRGRVEFCNLFIKPL